MKEKDMSFRPGFGELQVVSDGGYEKGYADASAVMDSFLDGSITEFKNDTIKVLCDAAFFFRTNLKKIDIVASTFSGRTFYGCSGLEVLILRSKTLIEFRNSDFSNSSFRNGSGVVYVPDELMEGYFAQAAYFIRNNEQLRPLSEYVEEGE